MKLRKKIERQIKNTTEIEQPRKQKESKGTHENKEKKEGERKRNY